MNNEYKPELVFEDKNMRLIKQRVSAGFIYIVEIPLVDAMGGKTWVEKWRGGVW